MSDDLEKLTSKGEPLKQRRWVTGKQRRQWMEGMKHCDEKRYAEAIVVLKNLLEQEIPDQDRSVLQGSHRTLADSYDATGQYALAITHTALAITYCGTNDPFEQLLNRDLERRLKEHPEITRPKIL